MDTTLGWGSDVLIWNAVVLMFVSLGVGLLGGFVGLALGTMRLPAMLLMGMGAPTAGGTNILVSSISSIFGAIRHVREGRVNFKLVAIMGGPAFVGAFIGGVAMGTQRCHSWLIDSLQIMVLMLTGQVETAWKGGSSATPHGSQRQRGPNSCQERAGGIQAYSGHGLYLIYRGCPDNLWTVIAGISGVDD